MKAVQRKLRLVSGPGKPDLIFGGRPREELEFLPAALEIVETPPPPLPRVAALVIVGLLVCAIAWATLSKVDIVSSAQGRFVPAGGAKLIQPLESGVVAAIRVQDGQQVKAGDVLVELEPTQTQADRDQLQAQLAGAELDVARLETVALHAPFAPPRGADLAAVEVARRQAAAEQAEHAAKLAALDHQVEQQRAQLATAEADVERLRQMAPLAGQQVEVYQNLEARGYGSKLQLLQAREGQQQTLQSLESAEHKRPELQAAIAATINSRAQAAAEAAQGDLSDLSQAEVKAAALSDQLAKAADRFKERTLTAPVDGAVQELAVHTIGGVVQPGQVLMRITPNASAVEVEARLDNQDVGFVRAGMAAQLKVQTFPYTRYGLVPAKVVSVSRDAVADEAAAQPAAGATDRKPVDDLHFTVRLVPDRDTIDVDGSPMRLTPGMAVTAEVLTGKRRVIGFILSPLVRATREAGHER
jgi:hemolysin D